MTSPLGSKIDQEQKTVNQQTKTALATALLEFGIDRPTIDRLTKHHDAELITQKIDYVVFMQEQRRLFYVGCTRAMHYLFITYDRQLPSPFWAGLTEKDWQRV